MDSPRPLRQLTRSLYDWLKHPTVCSALCFACTALAAAAIIQPLHSANQREVTAEMAYWAQAFSTKLQGRLAANLAVGYGLEAQISVLEQLPQAQLDIVAGRLLKDRLNIRHIALAPDLVVNALYPLAGNEPALGLNYREHPGQREAALQAMRTGEVVLAGPLFLVQGGTEHLIARFPVYLKDRREWGLISLVIEFEGLLVDAGIRPLQQKYDIGLRGLDAKGQLARSFFGDATLFQTTAQLHQIPVPGGEWQLGIAPKPNWYKPHNRLVLYWITALALCLSASASVLYLLRYNRARDQHLHQLAAMTAVDPLTQLTSRYQFNEYLTQLIEECQRTHQGFTVLFIDLDHFKEVNDSLGHSAGDQLLVQVAKILKSCVRSYDLLCRLNGDEFIAVLKGVTRTAEIENRARIISSRLSERTVVKGVQVSMTCSVGVAVYPTDGTDSASLIQHADLAMYEGKRTGRNALYFFNMSMRNEADRYIELSTALKLALAREEFEVYYQPIYDLRQKSFNRCEALCRWRSPEGGVISPAEFIPVAEQSGLICDLGAWVARQAMLCCRELLSQECSIQFSVNRSPQEFASQDYTRQLIEMRSRLNIPPHLLTLEITESLLMSDSGLKSQNFRLLKERNFQFSIDDFGTGYSALNYLRQYPVESIKIDRSFVAELGTSEQADTLVKVIIEMAKSLSIAVIAEGVETHHQMTLLEQMGCDYIQGFLLAKPMPKAEFHTFLLQHPAPAQS